VGSGRFEEVNISHMLFANDTLVFCRANLDHLRYLRVLFLCFEAVSSLKIYLVKYVSVLVGCVDNVDGLAGILGLWDFLFTFKASWPSVGGLF
jgi:hypothetical protein